MRRRALRPQLKVVRGGGSTPDRSVERRGAGLRLTSRVPMESAGASALPIEGATAAGQSVAQLGAQAALQQSMSSWSMIDEDDFAIGQSGRTAKAGPDVTARERASRIKARRRRMALKLGHVTLTDNYEAARSSALDRVRLL